ncbi:MAG: methionine--tRNA ligase [Phycisphaeraceae bacterium]|nr:methionine--tRNA ligase [Phycisphaerae bacterium]MBX3393545.1 methionine--tRNA ligase [Phycisphaeraceae bacterium]
MTDTTPYYVTTPIYYVNDRPHIGHCYTTLVADVAARCERLRRGSGDDVFFLTGTDEHAEKVVLRAAENQCSPMEWATRNADEFKAAYRVLDLSYDDFVRTTEERHKARAAAYIARLMKSGDIELGDYEGWWDASQEEYLTETAAKESGFVSPVTGKPLERRREQNYFFRLDRYEQALLDLIDRGDRGEAGGMRIAPEARRNEVLGRIRGGLQRVPVSRRIKDGDVDWGIRMPGDPGHRVYVWIEALCNYLTVVDNQLEPATAVNEGGARRRFWPASVHFMAKDILWFHAVIWPAMLMAMGEKPPRTVYAHAYWVRDGRKMSKSLGNFIEIETLEAYAKRYSADAVRWYMLTQGPLGATDADFSHAKFVEVYNSDLANGIGNCASRVSNMIEKYFGGEVPEVDLPPLAAKFQDECRPCLRDYLAALDGCDLLTAAASAISMVRGVDQFIAQTRPFTLAKQMDVHGKSVAGILYYSAEVVRIASVLLSAAMPSKMRALHDAWGCPPSPGVSLAALCEFGGPYGLRPGHRIVKGDPLFMRADPSEPAPSAVQA